MGYFDDEWWLEFMEKEMDMELAKDMEYFLTHSLPDRKALKQLERLRNLVKETDEVALPEDGRFYDRFHAKIMASVHESALRGDAALVPASGPVQGMEGKSFSAVWCALTRRWSEL